MDTLGPNHPPLGDAELEEVVVACLAADDPRAELERRTAGRPEVFAAAWPVVQQALRFEQPESAAPSGSRDPCPDDRATWPTVPGVELECLIGQGGQGFVFKGRQTWIDRVVAVKVLAAQWRTPAFVERFRREARLLAGLQHAHIVTCHGAGVTDGGECHLVMELLDGPNLRVWIDRHGPVPLNAALRLGRALADALEHAHQRGLVHRDVKPENVLLQPRPSTAGDTFPFLPKLADLGLARAMPQGQRGTMLTPVGAIVGTPATMAPEQFDAPDLVDHRADIYGLGCVLHHALIGQPAFRGATMTDLVVQKAARSADAMLAMPGVPDAVVTLISRMLARDPGDRPQTWPAVTAALDGALAALDGAPRPRRPWRVAGAFGFVGLAAAAVAWAALHGEARRPSPPAPALAVAAPPAPLEGTQVELRAAIEGAVATAWAWRQSAGPPLEDVVVEGMVWRGRLPHGTAGAEALFEVTATTALGPVRREVRLCVAPDPAATPLRAGEVLALFATEGDDVMARWRCDHRAAWDLAEAANGARANSPKATAVATLVLPRGDFDLRGRIESRRVYQSPSAPQVSTVSAGLRLRFPGGAAAALLVRPSGDRFRAALVRQQATADGWRDVVEEQACEGAWTVDDPLRVSLRWSGAALEVRVGAARGPDAFALRVEPGRQWDVPWPPGLLELHTDHGVAEFTGWELAAVR